MLSRRSLIGRGVMLLILLVAAVWVVLPQGSVPDGWPVQPNVPLKLGLDLQGGSHLVYRADTSGIDEEEAGEALLGVRDVIERRVNLFGVSEPVVQTNRVSDEWRVIVELAGVHNVEEAIALIGQTPQLDFRREVLPEEAEAQFNIDDPSSVAGPLFERTELTGRHLQTATVTFDELGAAQVSLEFNSEGSDLFAQLTRENIGQRIAIYLDGVPISAPVVQSEITNGQAVITGGFSAEEARELARNLRAGALPVPIELIGQQVVGPSLGRVSLSRSLVAGLMGLLAVIVWMIVFYRASGVVASLALILYLLLFTALIKLLGVTLTLAGVAGVILSVGMAVDANVLIFERFRENLRAGKHVLYALDNGFKSAWSSIQASNVSSLLTAIILYWVGTSLVRGFAVTFSLGVALSMFTAITVTRTLLYVALRIRPLARMRWLLA